MVYMTQYKRGPVYLPTKSYDLTTFSHIEPTHFWYSKSELAPFVSSVTLVDLISEVSFPLLLDRFKRTSKRNHV